MPSADTMGQKYLCHKTSRTAGAVPPRNSVQMQSVAGLCKEKGRPPAPHTGEQLNGDHKRCGERGETTQGLVEIGEWRKRRWPDGQAKAGRKQGEARLQIEK